MSPKQTPSQQFERELEAFRQEVYTGSQALYAYLAIHASGRDRKEVHIYLNRSALFWNTALSALQMTFIVVLGRIFDADTAAHSVHRLLSLCLAHRDIFSKSELLKRKQGGASEIPSFWADYEKGVFVPTTCDFQLLKQRVAQWRTIYDQRYRDLRRQYFAHKQRLDSAEVDAMFGRTNLREIQRLYGNLMSLHTALQDLFVNGNRPKLRARRFSIAAMRRNPSPSSKGRNVQERIAHETEVLLLSASSVAPANVRARSHN